MPISELKVTELKQELRKRRLPQGGLKKDMVDRLSKFVQENEEIAGEGNALDPQNQSISFAPSFEIYFRRQY